MSNKPQQLSWKERALAQDMEQESEFTGASTSAAKGGMGVVWASSQGGCDPLKKLLRDAEGSALVSPTQRQHSPLTGFSSTTTSLAPFARRAPPLRGLSLSQASSSSTSSGSSSGSSSTSSSSATDAPKLRPIRRTRTSLSRGGEMPSSESGSSTLSLAGGGTPGTPAASISDILSRVSRSLNERALAEYSHSQQRRIQQAQVLKKHPTRRNRSHTQILPARLPQTVSSRCSTASQDQLDGPVFNTCVPRGPTLDLPSSSSSAPPLAVPPRQRATAITDSPHRVRIKALLETIDHAEPFPAHASSSAPSNSRSGSKNTSQSKYSCTALRAEGQLAEHPLPSPSPRKTLALGMRRPVLVQPALPNPPPQSHAAGAVSRLTSSQVLSKAPRAARDASSSATTSRGSFQNSHHVTGSESDNEDLMDVDMSLDDGAEMTHIPSRGMNAQQITRGYRPSALNPASLRSESLSLPHGDDSVGEKQAHASRARDVPLLPAAHRIKQGIEDDLEANASSDGASSGNSSYGDIDIDPAALEEACKAYD